MRRPKTAASRHRCEDVRTRRRGPAAPTVPELPPAQQPCKATAAPHSPRVVRGRDNQGSAGMRCGTATASGNNEASRVPGAALEDAAAIHDLGRTVDRSALPRLKDPGNGGRLPSGIVKHMQAMTWCTGLGTPAAVARRSRCRITCSWSSSRNGCRPGRIAPTEPPSPYAEDRRAA